MAEKLNTYQIPNEGKVINVGYAICGGNEKAEMEYIPERRIGSKVLASITEIKKKNQKIGLKALFKPGDKLAA